MKHGATVSIAVVLRPGAGGRAGNGGQRSSLWVAPPRPRVGWAQNQGHGDQNRARIREQRHVPAVRSRQPGLSRAECEMRGRERNRASKGEVSVEGGQEGWVQELVLVRPEEKCC